MPGTAPRLDRVTAQAFVVTLLAPIALGTAPLFGKLAYMGGADPFTVAASRTVVAAAILWILYLLFWRRFIYIFPAGLLGCVVVGMTNGIGSLFYYNGLRYLNASTVQLLNATYLIFVVLLTRLGGQPLTRRTMIRAMMALVAISLVTGGISGPNNWLGAGLIIGNAILFAGTVILSRRVLYEMPPQTFTLYVLTTMAIVVVMARAVYRLEWIPQSPEAAWAIVALGVTTALSRLALFLGVKQLGSLQTALVGVFETGVALLLAFVFLHEQLSVIQWLGVAILTASLLLARPDDLHKGGQGEIANFNMAGMSFQHVAFTKAFGDVNVDVTPEEMAMIQKMMSAPPRYDTPSAPSGSGDNEPEPVK